MRKTSLVISVLVILSVKSMAQEPSDKQLLDSLIKHDDLMQMLDSLDRPKSYAKINVGIGNRLFSVNNNSLNASQANSTIVLTPSLNYYHKSGFGVSAAAYLLKNNSKTKFYQYALTPSYDYQTSKTVGAGISYTRFITEDEYGGSTSPVQNDFYGYVSLKKPWLKPGLAFGYSSGSYKDIETIKLTLPVLGERIFDDTATTKIKSFSLMGTLEHTFEFYSLISGKDNLSITPTFLANAGTSKFVVTHKNKYSERVKKKKRKFKRSQSDISSFQLESLGLSLDLNYSIGKFNFQPQLYLDYYLPETDYKRFSQVFTINIGLLL